MNILYYGRKNVKYITGIEDDQTVVEKKSQINNMYYTDLQIWRIVMNDVGSVSFIAKKNGFKLLTVISEVK